MFIQGIITVGGMDGERGENELGICVEANCSRKKVRDLIKSKNLVSLVIRYRRVVRIGFVAIRIMLNQCLCSHFKEIFCSA
jgi:hypothetical protein